MSEPTADRLLDAFLNPRSVAIIGLSRSAVGAPVSILTTLGDLGYEGRVHIVNPGMTSAPGAEVHARIADLPDGVDLAIVSVERTSVPDSLQRCAERGIGAAVVITQGFADADAEGSQLQEQLVAISRQTGMRIIGPNTIGVANPGARFSSSFVEIGTEILPVGQVAQSGFLMMGHHLINNEAAGYCLSVDLGNACDIGLVDVLAYFASDDRVRVVECHIEAIENGPAFLEAARRVTRTKPMVVLKAGRTEAGQAAVASHTGNVAGQARIYDAAFRQAGVIQADNAEELRLLSKAFAVYGKARGKRIAVVSFSGGGAVLSMDALDRAGLELAQLSEATLGEIADLFPDWIEIHNPLDIWIPVAKDLNAAFPRILGAVMNDPAVDMVLCIYCAYTQPKYELLDVSAHIRKLSRAMPEKPLLCWSYGQDIEGTTRRIEADGSAMVFPSLDDAARVAAALADHGTRNEEPAHAAPAFDDVDSARARTIVQQAIAASARYLFTGAMEMLDAYGFVTPKWSHVADETELVVRGREFSTAVCLKIVSPDLVHKSDSGGVMLGLSPGTDLEEAGRTLKARVRSRLPDARLTGLVVQEMAEPGVEVMMGMVRDAAFGPCITFGAGGVMAELIDDFAFRVAPLSEQDARDMIAETSVSRLLEGVRGTSPADREAVVDTLLRLARLAMDHPEIHEIDLNPVFAGPAGCTVVDVRMLLTPDAVEGGGG